jgi:CRP/FNR family transcriptional regulator, cyclic AMP receptor protein
LSAHHAGKALHVRSRSVVALLDADRELGESLQPAEHERARRAVVVPVLAFDAGPWDPGEAVPDPPAVGLLVLQGVLTREIVFAGRASSEIVGAGDVLRPWDDDVSFAPLPFGAAWHAHAPIRIAILDARFALASGRWPALASAIGTRQVRRTRALAFQLALAQLPRVDDRVLVLLWSLAERWGRVGPLGVRLVLSLPHRTLATLVGARRPSVTTALSGLARAGLVERTEDGWLLHGDGEEVLAERLGRAGTDVGALAL